MTLKDISDHDRAERDSVQSAATSEVRNCRLEGKGPCEHILASAGCGKKHEPIDLEETIRRSLNMVRPTLPANIKIRENLAASSLILGDQAQIHQVMMNLCSNAAHAMEETGGVIEVDLSRIKVDQEAAQYNPEVPAGSYLK
jgi:signal transduction histidine kinase